MVRPGCTWGARVSSHCTILIILNDTDIYVGSTLYLSTVQCSLLLDILWGMHYFQKSLTWQRNAIFGGFWSDSHEKKNGRFRLFIHSICILVQACPPIFRLPVICIDSYHHLYPGWLSVYSHNNHGKNCIWAVNSFFKEGMKKDFQTLRVNNDKYKCNLHVNKGMCLSLLSAQTSSDM